VFGDAQPGCDVAQVHHRVVRDAQQHPGVVGQGSVHYLNRYPVLENSC